MFGGKNKAVTFSYDDGVLQDVRTIEILNKYGLKATFNINSGLLGLNRTLPLSTGDGFVDMSSQLSSHNLGNNVLKLSVYDAETLLP